MSQETLKKQLLREQVLERIRDGIVNGAIAAGGPLNEQSLAEQYGLSRTPVREALLGLEGEGFVKATANRGFKANELRVGDAPNLYAVRAVLESMALQLSGVPDASTLHELEALNDEMKAESVTREQMIDLDETFHTRLIARCPNEVLKHILTGLRLQSRRYEFVFFGSARKRLSTDQHDQILAFLTANRLSDACSMLANNIEDLSKGWIADESQ